MYGMHRFKITFQDIRNSQGNFNKQTHPLVAMTLLQIMLWPPDNPVTVSYNTQWTKNILVNKYKVLNTIGQYRPT